MRFLPGPMDGVMVPAWIRAAARLELAERWITPFFRVSSALPRRKCLLRFLSPFMESGKPVTVQLMGTDPALLSETASAFVELGASGIDFNFGCPCRRVTAGGAGGGALTRPPLMRRIVAAVRGVLAPSVPVSVKIRSGWRSPDELERILPAVLCDGAVDFLTVHCRTVAEAYLPVADRESRWERAVRLASGVPVILNGDIGAAEEMRSLPVKHGAAGAMAARGLLHDPWLLRRASRLDAPPAPYGRRLFFETVVAAAADDGGLPPGYAVGLSNFLWGEDNPYFSALKGRRRPVTPSELPALRSSHT